MNQSFTTFFKDFSGNNSSKRLSGLALIALGMIEKFTLFLFGLFHTLIDFNFLDGSANWLIVTGSGLLTATIAENAFNINNGITKKTVTTQ